MKKPTFFISEKKFSPKVFTTWFYAWFIIFFSFQNKISQKVFWLCFVFLTMIKTFVFLLVSHMKFYSSELFSLLEQDKTFHFRKKHFFFRVTFFSPNRDLYFIWLHTWRIYNCSVDRTFLSHIFLFFVSSRFLFCFLLYIWYNFSVPVASYMISFFSTIFFSLGFTLEESEHFLLTKLFLFIYPFIYFLSPAKKSFLFGFQHELFDLLKCFFFFFYFP